MLRNTFAASFLIREVSGNQRHVAAGAPGAAGSRQGTGPAGRRSQPLRAATWFDLQLPQAEGGC